MDKPYYEYAILSLNRIFNHPDQFITFYGPEKEAKHVSEVFRIDSSIPSFPDPNNYERPYTEELHFIEALNSLGKEGWFPVTNLSNTSIILCRPVLPNPISSSPTYSISENADTQQESIWNRALSPEERAGLEAAESLHVKSTDALSPEEIDALQEKLAAERTF